jgi:hypothetical protein
MHPNRSRALLLCAVACAVVAACQPFEDLSQYPFENITSLDTPGEDGGATGEDGGVTDKDTATADKDTDADEEPDGVVVTCSPFDPRAPYPEGAPVSCVGGGDACCPPAMVCELSSGLCVCEPGKGDCDGKRSNGCEESLNTLTDCGACGRVCAVEGANATDGVCKDGACILKCEDGFADCDGAAPGGCEVDISTSRAHCGACGQACAAGQVCDDGVCRCINRGLGTCGVCDLLCGPNEVCDGERCVCPAGWVRCNGVCRDLSASEAHCGACNVECLFGALCVEGECRCGGVGGEVCVLRSGQACCGSECKEVDAPCCDPACPPGETCCNGQCKRTAQDAGHCGACGVRCGPNEQCFDGQCYCGSVLGCQEGARCQETRCICREGLTLCGGDCVDTERDAAHCGDCHAVCPPVGANGGRLPQVSGGFCDAGGCALLCDAGWGDCDGAQGSGCEVNLSLGVTTSSGGTTHCGACGARCDINEQCREGQCVCRDGLTRCDGACVNTATNANHCGQCGRSCRWSESCVGGECCILGSLSGWLCL